ncbi:ribose-phosphate pyrophosphokinase [Leptospira ellisii]|uniref:ribose-phosphate diphosphokinase n=1 Tax=Leptospira ellisii TaxID=2023197 RepID=A0AAE4QMX8_9LEPT|nr:ribose-phosphate pyrophosphokinase [Leptospira ellisii]MDV6235577.1 ribose-phosphate pyrophosphokinase [Leptospira ellisii]
MNINRILFAFPENAGIADLVASRSKIRIGSAEFGTFPDGESKLRIVSDLKGSEVHLICSLDRPDSKLLPLIFFCETARSLGAEKVHLIAPYLCYMRQDKVFREGEGISARIFADLISRYVDSLITVDPHLHRIADLSEIFRIPSKTLHSTALLADYIRERIDNPVLVGPDSESSQWVAEVARLCGSPFIVLEKNRKGDREVEISAPAVETLSGRTPVLIDDIVSSGRTLIETVKRLREAALPSPICLCVHGIFADDSYRDLLEAGVRSVVTSNTIGHPSNGIDVSRLITENLF